MKRLTKGQQGINSCSKAKFLLLTTIFSMAFSVSAPSFAQTIATRVVQVRGAISSQAFDGTVEAVKQATVAAQVSGKLLEMRAEAGQTVRQGDFLMRIDARESAEAVAAAQAVLSNARINLERNKSLHLQKFVSRAAVDKAQAELDAALAATQSSQAAQSHALIVAPMSGLIANRYTELGEMAMPGKPLLSIYDPASLRIVLHVPQSRLAEIKVVKKALVELSEGARIESAAVQILPTLDAQTHAVEVRVSLPSSAQAVPGMAGRVFFSRAERSILSLPQHALLRRGEVTSAYVKDAKGKFALRQLRVGEGLPDGEVEILAGLVSGEEIAINALATSIALKKTSVTER